MSVFTFAPMRHALPRVAPISQPQPKISLQLPSFTGMRLSKSMPVQMTEMASNILEGAQNGSKWFAMRHGNRKITLNRPADQRKALIRGLVTEVLRHGKITTTKTRAKAIRKHVDKMIGLAKRGTLHARRQALAFVYDPALVKSVFENAPSRYNERPGGYCRVVTELQRRKGDNAEMATIELV